MLCKNENNEKIALAKLSRETYSNENLLVAVIATADIHPSVVSKYPKYFAAAIICHAF